MQSHHLLAALRIEKPKDKSEFIKILHDHDIVATKEIIEQAWQHCEEKQYKYVIEVLQQPRIRSISLNSQKIQKKLKPLVYIFDKMDLLRENNNNNEDSTIKRNEKEVNQQLGISRFETERKLKEVNQQLNALRFEAERKLKEFINESCIDRSFTSVLQEKIVEFQEERNKLNEKQAKEGIEKAQQRLEQRQKMKKEKLEQQLQFVLMNDDNKIRAEAICKKLQEKPIPRYKSTFDEKKQQRFDKIMNTKFIL